MPSKDKKRELYLAGSMAELQKKSEVKPQTTNARILVKSADTMFREAEKVDVQGDEERAFIMYMRYFNIVKQVKTNADYKKNKQYYDSLLGQKNQVRAIEQAEQLAASLKERYDFKEAEAVAQKFAALEASGQRKEKEAEVDSEKTADNKNSSVEDGSKNQPSTSASSEATKPVIAPTALCNLLRETSTQLIIMDARWSADFAESHINHACCISVPQEALTPGTTVNGIENQLPSESLSLWKQRGMVDHIVLLDWSSHLESLVISSPLRTLKDALFVYDSTVIIKSEPLVLEGGYEQWLLFYPTLTTNSRVTRPTSSAVISSVALLDFDYPEFEEPQPPKADEPDKASVKDEQTVNNMNAAIRATSNASTIPQFNRALKPRAAGQSIGESIAKTSELNNARNVNLARDAPSGEGVAMLTNHLYPSFVVAPSNKKGEKNTNVVAEEGRVRENGSKRTEDRTPPPAPAPTTPPPPPPPAESAEEAQARARLAALEEKRRKEERALADIMRQKRHMEQDLKEMQTLSVQERQIREAHEKTIKEEEAERKRQAEVEKLRLERKKKELEAERDKDRQEFLAREKDLQEARERDEEERQAAQRATQQHAEKLRQERAEKARQEAEKRQQEEEQARQEAEKQAQLREVAAHKAEEEKKQKEEEERRKKEEEERVKKEEEERRKKKEKEEAEEKARQAKKAEDEKRLQERENQAGTIRQAQEPKMIPSPTLPPGWEKRLDNSTRRYYYIDHNHGKTQWEPPAMTTQPQQKDTYKTRLKEEPTTSTRGGLSRSHSSPDIMKQLADEARMGSRPVYDRASKPSVTSLVPEVKQPATRAVARRRDLNPVYGNVGPAMTGLRNLGNTCYMNSTVQCLNNTTPLVTYFLNDYYLNDINRDSSQGMHGEVVDEFAVVVKALWSGQYRSITPRDLKNTVGKYNPLFAGYQQQDSQEFLTFLLDGLHEGLNEVKQRPQIPDQDNDRLPDAKAAHLAWENHKRLHRSIIVELFQGQLKSTLECRTCHKTSVTFQASMYISLPIPASNRCSLKDCLRAFLQPEMMTGSCKWKCPQCRVERDAEKKIDIWKLPHILLIGLNRFVSDGMWMQKKTTYVDFPINDLDLEEFTLGPKNRSRYSLYGVSNHYGTMEGGHYTAFCRNPCNSKWHKFDDQEVYEMSQSDVKTSAAFVLYYTSIPLNAPQFKRKL